MRPLPYKFANNAIVLGQYQVAQRSGAIAATPSALDDWARIRWVPPSVTNAKLVLTRLRVGMTVISAVTAAVQRILQASIGRNYSVDHGTAITNISMVGDNGKMSKSMGTSQMGATGPGICTTAPMTGHTVSLDSPFGMVTLPPLSPTLGAAAVTEQVGGGCEMFDLYNWQQMGGHPPMLSSGEGIVIETLLAGHATGTLALHVEWSWCECINPFGND